MLKECRTALKIKTEEYDGDLCQLMKAAAKDLEVAGVVLPGTVAFTETTTTAGTTITDTSTLKDPLVQRAIFTYVRNQFFRDDWAKESYGEQKVQLMHAGDYTDYEDGGDGE